MQGISWKEVAITFSNIEAWGDGPGDTELQGWCLQKPTDFHQIAHVSRLNSSALAVPGKRTVQ